MLTSLRWLGVRQYRCGDQQMDLVGYDEGVFEAINKDFSAFFDELAIADPTLLSSRIYYVPVSALTGDNVVHTHGCDALVTGPSLLGVLERIPSTESVTNAPFRLAVQRVMRPDQNCRGFAGQIASGTSASRR